jgi:hypothetical protein
LTEGLIFKGWRLEDPTFQQSYPQKIWINVKDHQNQALISQIEKIAKP